MLVRMRRFCFLALLLVIASLAVGCGGNSPEKAVREFYKHLNAGNYSTAKELYTAEARSLVDSSLMALAGGFSQWADQETKVGTVEEVNILSSEARGETATVDYEIVYEDGSTVRKIVSLLKEDGSWKIGLIPSISTPPVALVQDIEWTYVIQLEELEPVTDENWRDEVPSGAQLGNCKQKLRRTESEPVPGAQEVCGTPYMKDTGDGKGQVVQDCEYQIFDGWCKYTVDDWKSTDEKVATGHDLNPTWPVLNLRSDQREGKRSERYKVVFKEDGKTYTYRPVNLRDFRQFEIGSKWILEANAAGGVTSVQPAE